MKQKPMTMPNPNHNADAILRALNASNIANAGVKANYQTRQIFVYYREEADAEEIKKHLKCIGLFYVRYVGESQFMRLKALEFSPLTEEERAA